MRIQRVGLKLTCEGAPGDPPAVRIVLGYLRNGMEGSHRQINTAKAVHFGTEQAAAQICADPRQTEM